MLKVHTGGSAWRWAIAESGNRIRKVKHTSVTADLTKGNESADGAVSYSVCSCDRSLACNHPPRQGMKQSIRDLHGSIDSEGGMLILILI